MKPLVVILTGLHVLAHGMFGCCDHGIVATASAALPCVCEHAHHHTGETPVHDDCDAVERHAPAPAPHECAHASCHWVAGSAGPSVTPLDLSAPVIFFAVVPAATSGLHAAAFQPDDVWGRVSAPPLRLHLALGVLVV